VASETDRRSLLERALSLVTRVEAGEGVTALLLTLDVFLLMTAYSTIKPVREGLILVMKSGAEYKAYMGGAIAIALLVAVPAYSRFADKAARNRLVVGVTLFFVSNLVLFWLVSSIPSVRARLGLIFYVWLGVFNMMVVAQFWAFANDIYKEEQGKRLFPLLGVGQTVGAVAGAGLAVLIVDLIGVYPMLLVASAVLAGSAFLTQVVHRRASKEQESPVSEPAIEDKPDRSGAFALVMKSRYLTFIAAFSLIFTFVNTNGEYMLGRLLKGSADAAVAAGTLEPDKVKEFLTAAYGRYQLFTNVATVGLQTFVVSRLVRVGGLKVAFFVMPGIALADAVGVSAFPVLTVLFIGKIAENATDYSLNNTVRNMLWLPTTREMKYKAKQAVDTFFVRMGDVSSALLVYVGASVLGFGVRMFAIVNIVLCGVWVFLAIMILRGYNKLQKGSVETKSSSPPA
jgi:AAA family ATP:ADP antiporter